MIKINLNKDILGLDKTPIAPMGKVLAEQLANAAKGDALKFFGWAQSFYDNKEVTLDKSDLKNLVEFINEHSTLTIAAKAQMLETLDACEKQE
jgi:hypothetical protein